MPNRFDFLALAACAGITLLCTAAFGSTPATYSYTGSPFDRCNGTNSVNGNCPANFTSDYIAASFTFSTPLAANLSSANEASSPNLAAWSVHDALGYASFSSSDANAAAELVKLSLSTNGNGAIVGWNVQISNFVMGEQGGTGFFFVSPAIICGGTGLPCADNIVSINGASSNLGNAAPGQFTQTAAGGSACSSSFPAFFVPFTSVYYVSAPNAAGDRLLVGSLPAANLTAIQQQIPLPSAANQQFCSKVMLAPNYTLNAYVPTASERLGDFSADGFGAAFIDPTKNQPFPGGVIPPNELGTVYAWRIPSAVAPQNNVVYTLSLDFSGVGVNGPGSTVVLQFAVPSILTTQTTITTFTVASLGPGYNGCGNITSFQIPQPDSSPYVAQATATWSMGCGPGNAFTGAAVHFRQSPTSPGVYNAYSHNGDVLIGALTIAQGTSLTSLSPASAAASSGSFALTVIGTGFVNGAAVQWNGTALATTFVSATQLTATVPNSLLDSPGTVNITVAGAGSLPFMVNPPGQPCTFTFAPSSSFGAAGGPGVLSVTASRSDCILSPVSNAPWITITVPPILSNTTVNYTVAPNPGATSRTGTITIGAQVLSVAQGGTTCTYSLPVSTETFGPAVGNGTAAIQAPPGCAWTATSAVPWVTITPPAGGSGDGAVAYTVAPNPSPTARSAILTIATLPYTVFQEGSGNTAACTASVPSPPQIALEGRTETLGDYFLNCSGLSGALKTDISLALNANVTNTLTGGLTDAVLTVDGANPQHGQVAGYNSLRWPAVSITPAADGTATVRISHVLADASVLTVATPGYLLPTALTGQADVGGVPLTGALQTMANASQSLVFTKSQANPPAGGAQTSVPLVFQEGYASAFHAGVTRLRVVLSNVPSHVQVYAPVFPNEGAAHAQLYSADANGAGGSPVAGGPFAGGTYQQLTIAGGTATATWLVLAAGPAQIDTFTFPLFLTGATAPDLVQITVSGSLAPVSDVSIASANAPVPRYRDFSVPQKLTGLRITTSFAAAQAPALAAVIAKAPLTGNTSVTAGSNVSFTSQLINDTSDPSQTATNIVVRDNLPSGLSLVTCTATGGATCTSAAGNQVQVNYPSLGPGQTASVTLVAQVDPSLAGTVVENPVSAASDEVNLDLFAGTSSVSFIVLPGTPVAAGGTPPSGGGASQTFTFQFSDPSGYQNLGVVNVLLNNFLDGRHACYLAYSVPSATLYLVDDAGDAGGPYAGSLALGNSAAIQNSQCIVSLVSATGTGPTLTLKLSITFSASFGGNRITYVAARDQAAGNSNWQPLGVWQVPYTAAQIGVGVSPARTAAPAGATQQLTFTFTDTKGTGDFGVGNVLINNFIDGRQACFLAFVAATNNLILIDDAGDAAGPYAGSMPVNGGSGAIQNSQCMVSAAGSAVTVSANTISLTLNITFKSSFSGNRVIYAAGRDTAGGNNTDWQSVGTVTVQ